MFISGKGFSPLKMIDGNINVKVYCDVLKFAKRHMDKLGVKYLQEDGAPAHSSILACEKRVELNIKVFLKKNTWKRSVFLAR